MDSHPQHVDFRKIPSEQPAAHPDVVPSLEASITDAPEQQSTPPVETAPIEELGTEASMAVKTKTLNQEVNAASVTTESEPVLNEAVETSAVSSAQIVDSPSIVQSEQVVTAEHPATIEPQSVETKSLNELEAWFGDASASNGAVRTDPAELTAK